MNSEPGVRVLLIEDDDDNRELMSEVLEAAGYEVMTAAGGAEGLRKLSETSVDVVITDVGMPGMGGLEVARVPVVVVTGYAEREDITSARGRNVDAVLVKPIDPDALTSALEEIMKGRRR